MATVVGPGWYCIIEEGQPNRMSRTDGAPPVLYIVPIQSLRQLLMLSILCDVIGHLEPQLPVSKSSTT